MKTRTKIYLSPDMVDTFEKHAKQFDVDIIGIDKSNGQTFADVETERAFNLFYLG